MDSTLLAGIIGAVATIVAALIAVVSQRRRSSDSSAPRNERTPDPQQPNETPGPDVTKERGSRGHRLESGQEVESAQEAEATPRSRALRVFLCHASGDKDEVRAIYRRLRDDGLEPWLDEEDLVAGQSWQQEIRKAVRKSDVVVVILSRASITQAGNVQKDIRYALDVAEEQPEGAIYIIPVKLESLHEDEIPERLRSYQGVNYFEEQGYERLRRALHVRAEQLGLR
jgi:hypothetical protein